MLQKSTEVAALGAGGWRCLAAWHSSTGVLRAMLVHGDSDVAEGFQQPGLTWNHQHGELTAPGYPLPKLLIGNNKT